MRKSVVCLLVADAVLSGCSADGPRACTPPRSYWQRPHNFAGLMPKMNEVAIDHAGGLYWNGEPVSPQQLNGFLTVSHSLNPEPVVFLQTEMGASCKHVEKLRDRMDEALECRKSNRCAEGIVSVWRELPTPPGTPVS